MLKFTAGSTAYIFSVVCSSGCSIDSPQPERSAHNNATNRRERPMFTSKGRASPRSKIAEHVEEMDCRNRASRNRERRCRHDKNKKRGFTCEIVSCLVAEIVSADVAERRARNIAAKIDIGRRLIIAVDDRGETRKPLTTLAWSIGGSSWFHIFWLNYSF